MDYPGKVITKNQVTPTQTSASGVWTLDDASSAVKNNNWPVAGVPDPISKSLRFNSADTAYLNKTFSSSGNRKKWTFSAWVKTPNMDSSTAGVLLDTGTNTPSINLGWIMFSANSLWYTEYQDALGYTLRVESTSVYRDPSAWYHVVVSIDTSQATNSNRVFLYVNNQTLSFTSGQLIYPSQNYETLINSNLYVHDIGRRGYAGTQYFNGYMAEVNFIDGQALTPSSFGSTDQQTGAWIPIKYTGTYGTNGFYLNFKDASSTSALGYDYSGNTNNWTTNNFSVTAGAGNDSLTDVPTPWVAYNTTGDIGGVVRGNYATMNPMQTSSTYTTFANGNLQVTDTTVAGSYRSAYSTIFANSGKYYFESTLTSVSGFSAEVGAASPPPKYDAYIGETLTGYQGYSYLSDGNKYTNDTSSSFGNSYASGDTISVAIDIDAGKIWFAKNGTWQASGDPAAGTNPAFNIVTGRSYGFAVGGTSSVNSVQQDCNFGQRPFAYTPPAGFLSLCTTNLPTPTIGATSTTQAGNYFNATLYTGTGSAFTLTGVGFQPDFGWFKGRNASSNNWLHDVVRGANPGLSSNNALTEDTTAGQLTSFASDGYSLPNDTAGYLNYNTRTMVVWSWKGGGAGVSNTVGSITSTVSVNTTSGFSVVGYTGNGNDNATVGHGLGVSPSMIIVRRRSGDDWFVYHTSLTSSSYGLRLNKTDAESSNTSTVKSLSSTTFTLGTDGMVNVSSNTYIAYVFSAVAGYSAFGKYTGNGSTDGPFVYTGFRPAYIMWKRTDSTSDWAIEDLKRDPINVTTNYLSANLSGAEVTDPPFMDFLSNGFKIRRSTAGTNASGGTYIYAAFAEYPFKFSNAR